MLNVIDQAQGAIFKVMDNVDFDVVHEVEDALLGCTTQELELYSSSMTEDELRGITTNTLVGTPKYLAYKKLGASFILAFGTLPYSRNLSWFFHNTLNGFPLYITEDTEVHTKYVH